MIYKVLTPPPVAVYIFIPVLSVFTKIFEMAVNNRLNFVSTAYDTADRFNGGFTQGSRTSDNIFILQGLIERQNILGKPIFMCMVDFSKAFDLVNRNILFFKLIKSGVHGKVIDTLRSLYKKTYYRVKCHGRLSPIITENIGVNQGGNASPTLFRHFLSDLGDYLHTHCELCITDDIIVHLLWADDLVLISDSHKGLQKLLNGLHEFCAKNLMIVNEVKTKVLVYGQKNAPDIYFNGQRIEAVQSYKYLGNIISTIASAKGDIFRENYSYLCNQAKEAIFGMKQKLKHIGKLPPRILFHMFETLIRPILLYGSDVWGIRRQGNDMVDKVFYCFIRCALGVKATTSNLMVLGESGQMPPSVFSHTNVICYLKRLHHLPSRMIVKQMYIELCRLHECGFVTWVTKAQEVMQYYGIELGEQCPTVFKQYCKQTVKDKFVNYWTSEIQNSSKNPIIRYYNSHKTVFCVEEYLDTISDIRYRTALTRLRTSSHTLEIERGRYTVPRTPICDRLCIHCNDVEDEIHFLVYCKLYEESRHIFYQKVARRNSDFLDFTNYKKYIFLMKTTDPFILVWFGKYVFKLFNIRTEHNMMF